MTLDTRVLLVAPRSTDEVHAFVNRELLARPDAAHDDADFWSRQEPERRYFANRGGQGLSAWFIGYSAADAPTQAVTWVGDDETEQVVAEGSMMLSFDTAYGYRVGNAGCGDLHAWFVARLAQQFGDLWFYLESWGEWHRFTDEQAEPLRRLGDPDLAGEAIARERALDVLL